MKDPSKALKGIADMLGPDGVETLVIGIDFAGKPDHAVVKCLSCGKFYEVIDGKMPDVNWCGCGGRSMKFQ